MRDLIGEDAVLQQKIIDSAQKIFESYGYQALFTPAVENFELFSVKGGAGEAIKEEIYYFKDKSDRELGLRFEFTASLARVATNNQLKMPYKRYQIGEVYRYDRPQAKRYRAFYQADIDILGVEGLEAELELMFIARDYFSALNLKPVAYFNSRKLLNDLLKKKAKGKEIETMRILDKLDKLKEKEVKEMLKEEGVDGEIVDIIKKNDLKEIETVVGKSEGLKEVKEFLKMCKENKLDFVEFNASLARGLEYYTGIVFECKVQNGPSICGGGRFDKLIGKYSGKDVPASGISFGISRIFDYLKEKKEKIRVNGMYLLGLGIDSEKLNKFASELREKGVICEINLKGMKLSKAFDYAEKKGYRVMGIIGEDELKKGKISVKNLINGMKFEIEMDASKVKELLEK
jgi:histidyl-tRNA synthetase